MEKIFFKEEQMFDQVWFRLIILLAWVPMIVIFGIGIYQQIVLGKPWGDHPTSDTGLLLTAAFIFLVMTGVTWLAFSVQLITEVTEAGFRYRFPPFILKFRIIPKHNILEYKIRKYNPLLEYGGWGFRQWGFGKGTAYNIKGRIGLQFYLYNGKKILFGTQRPEALQSAMDKLVKTSMT